MDVPRQFEQIRVLLADDGLVPILKEMPVSLMPAVEIDHIAGQQLLHALGERPRPRAHQEVEVARHEGPGVHDQVSLLAQRSKPVDEVVPVGVSVKDLGALNAPADDMLQGPGGIQAGVSRRARWVLGLSLECKLF